MKFTHDGFHRQFRTELDCIEHLYAWHCRVPHNVACERCGKPQVRRTYHTGKTYRHTACGHCISVTAGTPFERTHFSLLDWFKVIHQVDKMRQAGRLVDVDETTCATDIPYDVVEPLVRRILREGLHKFTPYIEVPDNLVNAWALTAPQPGFQACEGYEAYVSVVADLEGCSTLQAAESARERQIEDIEYAISERRLEFARRHEFELAKFDETKAVLDRKMREDEIDQARSAELSKYAKSTRERLRPTLLTKEK